MALIDALGVLPVKERMRLDRGGGRLVGSRCGACDTVSWPARAICQRCGAAPMAAASFEPTGALLTYTTVWVGRSGLEPPYVLGQVKLDDGPLVFAHVRGLDAEARVPTAVRLAVADDADSVPPFWFQPEEER